MSSGRKRKSSVPSSGALFMKKFLSRGANADAVSCSLDRRSGSLSENEDPDDPLPLEDCIQQCRTIRPECPSSDHVQPPSPEVPAPAFPEPRPLSPIIMSEIEPSISKGPGVSSPKVQTVSSKSAAIATPESQRPSFSTIHAVSIPEPSRQFLIPAAPIATRTSTGTNAEQSSQPPTRSRPSSADFTVPSSADEEAFRDYVLKGPNQPPGPYPVKKSRCFQARYYELYDWLEYSAEKDAMYCFACRCFSRKVNFSPGRVSDAFTTVGCNNWKRATEKLNAHNLSAVHKQAASLLKDFVNKSSRIDALLSAEKERQIRRGEEERSRNRMLLERLFKLVIILGKAGAPFRGHNEEENSPYRGLYRELYDLLAEYDPILKHISEVGPKNANYTSKTVQNDLIASVHEVMIDHFVDEIQKANYVSIIMDETTDCARHEQVAVLLRWVTQELAVSEALISVERTTSTTAEALLKTLTSALETVKLTFSSKKIIAQCYDGASAMQGVHSGLQARVKDLCENEILTVHCYAHCLCLVLVDSMKSVRGAFNFFGTVQTLYSFIEGSATRHAILERVAKEADSKLKKIKALSETRWSSRAEAINILYENYDVLIQTLQEMTRTLNDGKAVFTAKALLSSLKSYEVIFWMVSLRPLLNMINSVSMFLQADDQVAFGAVETVNTLEKSILELRKEEHFRSTMEEVREICERHDISKPSPRVKRISKLVDDHPETEHKEALDEKSRREFLEVLDRAVMGLRERFSQNVCELLNCFQSVFFGSLEQNEVKRVAEFCGLNSGALLGEAQLARGDDNLRNISTFSDFVKAMKSSERSRKLYPNVHQALIGLMTIPMTTAGAERTFSKLALIKSKIRSTMTQDRLSHLLIMSVENELCSRVDINDCIGKFTRKNRKLKF